jgi:dienelactone hydrolase
MVRFLLRFIKYKILLVTKTNAFMKQPTQFSFLLAVGFAVTLAACNNNQSAPAPTTTATEEKTTPVKIREDEVTYKDDTTTLHGYVAYDEGTAKKRPGVLVVPEWWGITDYTRSRAKQLAGLGYIAITVDMYGNGRVADNPKDAGAWAMPFYKSAPLAKGRLDAALAKLQTYSQLDSAHIAAIGYCFGGAMVLNGARLGEPYKGVVSFHGGLMTGVPAVKGNIKAKLLVLHGEDDKFVLPAEVAAFKKQMDSVGVDYTFKSYPGATHAFTNPEATAMGAKFNIPIAYNAAADSASWKEMKEFFGKIFRQ